VVQVIRESTANEASGERPFYDFLEGCLRHKSEMVIFEAARYDGTTEPTPVKPNRSFSFVSFRLARRS